MERRLKGIFITQRIMECLLYSAIFLSFSAFASPEASGFSKEQEIREFAEHMVRQHQFSAEALLALLQEVQPNPKVLEMVASPFEAKPWYEYRKIFLTDERAQEGVQFWNENQEWLLRAEEQYGVPPEIIVSILGVETRYGQKKGEYGVLEALTTLAFYYPPRSAFFRGELEVFLLLTREQNVSPLDIQGSYAGAIGKPQFVPSSIRHYGVDFDGDGQCDLINSVPDAIGSVANYFGQHHWRPKQPLAIQAQLKNADFQPLLSSKLEKPIRTIAEFKKNGIDAVSPLPEESKGFLFALENEEGPEYWLGLENLYVVTRYNRSIHYAMAVSQLSDKIASLRSVWAKE